MYSNLPRELTGEPRIKDHPVSTILNGCTAAEALPGAEIIHGSAPLVGRGLIRLGKASRAGAVAVAGVGAMARAGAGVGAGARAAWCWGRGRGRGCPQVKHAVHRASPSAPARVTGGGDHQCPSRVSSVDEFSSQPQIARNSCGCEENSLKKLFKTSLSISVCSTS